MLALPIFPARLQASIFGVNELNFRVRNGNGWTLITINTNSVLRTFKTEQSNFRIPNKRLHFSTRLNLTLVKVKPSAY